MITRRTLLQASATTGLIAAAGSFPMPAIAQGARIKLGYVSPQTGPLAAFAEADNFIPKSPPRPNSRSSSATRSRTRTVPPKWRRNSSFPTKST
jgi:hypothetical protein